MKATLQLWSYTRKYWKMLLLSIISASLYGIVSSLPTWIVKHTVDDIFVSKYHHLIIPFMMCFILFFILKGIFMYATTYSMQWIGYKVVNDIRHDLFNKIIYFPISFFNTNDSGVLISYFINDAQMIQQAASAAIKNGLRSVFEALFLCCFAFFQNFKLALLFFLMSPVIALLSKYMGLKIKKASLNIQKEIGHLSSQLKETFLGIKHIKAFNGQDFEKIKLKKQLARCFHSIMKSTRAEALLPSLIEVIAMISGAFAFYYAIHQVLTKEITPGQLTSFIASILLAYQPLKRLVSSYGEIQYGIAAAEKIFNLMDTPCENIDHGTIIIKNFQNSIVFKDVHFEYQKDKPILKNVNFTIKKGEVVGIIGPSGAGKSTICNLILGFIASTSGVIKIDETPLMDISKGSLRSKIGYVGQQVFLFNDTVFNNIMYPKTLINEDDIFKSCKLAHAHEFIQKLSHGYKTCIGENGNTLSGGQRQRLTIARALIKNPEIMVFDEVTSALDEKSEQIIKQTIVDLSQKSNKTLIVISHRQALLKNVDRVINTGLI
jgi:ATP-binding cassette, subfamily B, bacterial MsbA